MRIPKLAAIALATLSVAIISGCSSNSGASGNTVNWWTWDDKQAAAYKSCATAFEKENPGTTVTISQYAVDDYFTKLTAGFVAGSAPDAFQNSVQYFQAYANQHQLLPLDDQIAKTNFDLKKFSVGVDAWKYTDGKQYGLPLDWAATGLYYNTDALTKAGYTKADVDNLDWNPDNGGTFDKMVAHLTIDKLGVRGDQPGFDKTQVATYGMGLLGSKDFIGQTTWTSFVSTTGWKLGDKVTWPTTFEYNDPRFIKTMDYVRSLSDRGFAPNITLVANGSGASTVSNTDLMGTGKVAMETDGSWSASQYAKIPGVKVGIAPTVLGPDGKTRAVPGNSNGNNIWAGTKNPDLAFKWVAYMGSEACQTMASASGSFFPSIPASMDAATKAQAAQGVDLSTFNNALKTGVIHPAVVYGNGAAVQDALQPLFEAYFAHGRNDDVFPEMQQKSKDVLNKTN
ncbi:MAG: sugar transporter substrate-binding protein [Amycolatopsis sp.]|jgi:ABC-type glycerol-3-phosphate transport system substrate-binding protein|uniref:ABC transporter substrate-binding protein n=1 Tax=Amycolatopsis sp. TaxID=37632 RepID=UPI00261C0D14|nr:sugar ABC transporter substrate-binding protein [Amycolatopsis sp.]MCU1684201.1 sugar transporter substrate-binding protein [Amycolatopsis sp.]